MDLDYDVFAAEDEDGLVDLDGGDDDVVVVFVVLLSGRLVCGCEGWERGTYNKPLVAVELHGRRFLGLHVCGFSVRRGRWGFAPDGA